MQSHFHVQPNFCVEVVFCCAVVGVYNVVGHPVTHVFSKHIFLCSVFATVWYYEEAPNQIESHQHNILRRLMTFEEYFKQNI